MARLNTVFGQLRVSVNSHAKTQRESDFQIQSLTNTFCSREMTEKHLRISENRNNYNTKSERLG